MLMSLVSSNRIRTITKVKQAGNYAMGQIQNMVRGAKTITTCDSDNESITLINVDGGETQIFLEAERIASNSAYYLIPENLTVSNFNVTCNPDDIEPHFVDFSYDLQDNQTQTSVQNPTLHFATSINLRNSF
jgi:hypothetical protein